jgi:hypothetical protein
MRVWLERVDQAVESARLAAAEAEVRAGARCNGWRLHKDGRVVATFVRMRPQAVIVDRGGETGQPVAVRDVTGESVNGMARAGIVVTVICAVIAAVAGCARLAARGAK